MVNDVLVIECNACSYAGFLFFEENEIVVSPCECEDELTLDWINN